MDSNDILKQIPKALHNNVDSNHLKNAFGFGTADQFLSTSVTVTTTSFPSSPNNITSTSAAITTLPSAAATPPASTATQKAFLVLTILAWAAVTVSGTTQELSTTTGDTVNIPCMYGDGTLSSIFWAYNDGTGRHKILSLANWDLTIEPKYSSRASLQNDNSTLILKDITVADAGTYRCDVDRQGQTVVTNINTNLNVFSLRPDTLPGISPCTVADESSSCSIHANQTFTLTCTLPNVYPVEATKLIWYQDGQRVSFTNDVNTQNDDGTTDISKQIQVCETGNFTCNATYFSANGRENTVGSVEAWIIPLSDVPNTPGKNMTSGEIFCKTMEILLIVISIFLILSIALLLYCLKARGQRSSGKETNKSERTQRYQVTSGEALILLETSAEIGSKDGNVTSGEALILLDTSAEIGSKDGNEMASPIEEPDIDDILMAIAEKIQYYHINQFGKVLSLDKVEIERYVARNSRYMDFTCTGTLAMLRDWDKKRFKARERAALKKALMDIGLVYLAVNFLSEEGSVPTTEELNPPETSEVNGSKDGNAADSWKLHEMSPETGSNDEDVERLNILQPPTIEQRKHRTHLVTPSSLDILERFIISGLHPNGDKWVDWPHKKTVVCRIYHSYNFNEIVIRHNDPYPKHPEEILIEYINSKLDKTKMKSITLYLNYSSCTQCSRKLQILKKDIPDLQIRFSAFYYIRRQSCTDSCGCRTVDSESFKMLRKLDPQPFQKDDWDDLINLLKRSDEQKGYPTSDLHGLRYGDEYGVWRDGEDEKMMTDYAAMTRRNGEDENMIADYEMKSQ